MIMALKTQEVRFFCLRSNEKILKNEGSLKSYAPKGPKTVRFLKTWSFSKSMHSNPRLLFFKFSAVKHGIFVDSCAEGSGRQPARARTLTQRAGIAPPAPHPPPQPPTRPSRLAKTPPSNPGFEKWEKSTENRSKMGYGWTNMTGRPGDRTMEMIGGSTASHLACTPCVPLFFTSSNRGGNRSAFRLPGAGGGSFPLYGGTFARSYSVLNIVIGGHFSPISRPISLVRPKSICQPSFSRFRAEARN